MREKLVEILDSGADLDTWASDIMADRILAELRCDKCKEWDFLSGSEAYFGVCLADGPAGGNQTHKNEFCNAWEAK